MDEDIFELEKPVEPSVEAKQLGISDGDIETLVDLAMIQDVKAGVFGKVIPLTKKQIKRREASKRAKQARKRNRK